MKEPSYREVCEARRLEKILEKEGLAAEGRRCLGCDGRGFNWVDGHPRKKRVTAAMIEKGHELEAAENKSHQYRFPNVNGGGTGIDWSRIGLFAIRRVPCFRCRGKGIITIARAAKLLALLK